MLSLLIPSYNEDCSQLVRDLHSQCQCLKDDLGSQVFDYEIIVGDDASTDQVIVQANREACEELAHCRFISSEENVGQAVLRNQLADLARFPYLIFMDSDAAVCSTSFVPNYWASRDEADVVFGGVRNPDGACPLGCELRYRYEHHAEQMRTLEWRKAHPYDAFTAFNVMMSHVAFDRVRFDVRCRHYGYEDALMGLQLQHLGLTMAHIENPLVHLGIDSNASFMNKTETALRTLHSLGSPMTDSAGPSRWQQRLASWHLDGCAVRAFQLFKPLLRKNLLGRHPSVLLLNAYKLGYYCSLCR